MAERRGPSVHLSHILDERDKRYEQRFLDQEKAALLAQHNQEESTNAAFAAQQTAITKADAAHEKRLDSVNEFRGQLNDVINTMMPRAEAEAQNTRAVERVQELTDRMNRAEGRDKGVAQSWSIVLAIIGAVGTLIGIATAIIVFTR